MKAIGIILLWLILVAAQEEAHGEAHGALWVAMLIVAGWGGWELGGWMRKKL